MDSDQLRHYANKLAYEIDSWDLKVALENGERVIVLDVRSPQAYAAEHIPGGYRCPTEAWTRQQRLPWIELLWWSLIATVSVAMPQPRGR